MTWFQCVVAVATCAALGTMRDQARWLAMFPRFTYDLSLAKQVSADQFQPGRGKKGGAMGNMKFKNSSVSVIPNPVLRLNLVPDSAAERGVCGHDCF